MTVNLEVNTSILLLAEWHVMCISSAAGRSQYTLSICTLDCQYINKCAMCVFQRSWDIRTIDISCQGSYKLLGLTHYRQHEFLCGTENSALFGLKLSYYSLASFMTVVCEYACSVMVRQPSFVDICTSWTCIHRFTHVAKLRQFLLLPYYYYTS